MLGERAIIEVRILSDGKTEMTMHGSGKIFGM